MTEPVCGLEGLEEAINATSLPIVAIGGIQQKHLPELASLSPSAVAMISGLSHLTSVKAIEDFLTLPFFQQKPYESLSFPF